jgi:hypothetical protein
MALTRALSNATETESSHPNLNTARHLRQAGQFIAQALLFQGSFYSLSLSSLEHALQQMVKCLGRPAIVGGGRERLASE